MNDTRLVEIFDGVEKLPHDAHGFSFGKSTACLNMREQIAAGDQILKYESRVLLEGFQ